MRQLAMKVSTSLCGIGFAKKYPCIVEQPRRLMISTCSAVFRFDYAVESQVAAQVDHRLDDVRAFSCVAILRMTPRSILILSSDN
jgi:hypothetical protein